MFGALGVTPQVSDIGIVDAAGRAQRWRRGELRALREDWSSRPEVREWLAAGQVEPGRAWRPLLWKPAERVPSLLHQVPLHRAGQFVGMLGQVVPIAKVSEDLAVFRAEYEVTPFMLDGNDRVLGHPALAQRRADAPGAFPTLAELGDPVLERLRSPDGAAPLLAGLKQRARGACARRRQAFRVRIPRDRAARRPAVDDRPLPRPGRGRPARRDAARGLVDRRRARGAGDRGHARRDRRQAPCPADRDAGARRAPCAQGPARRGAAPAPQPHLRARRGEPLLRRNARGPARARPDPRARLASSCPSRWRSELLAGGGRLEPIEAKATVLVCDIEGFAALTDTLGAHRTIEFLNAYFEVVVAIVERYRGVVTQFQGDAILAVFNVPIAEQPTTAPTRCAPRSRSCRRPTRRPSPGYARATAWASPPAAWWRGRGRVGRAAESIRCTATRSTSRRGSSR